MTRRWPLALLTLAACSGEAADEPRELFADVFEATAEECPFGGERIAFGYDDDGDGALVPAETIDEALVCNGAPGADGADGEDGVTPLAWLVATADEAPGEACRFGGVRIASGVDTNGDGNLDGDEITDERFVCSASTDDLRIDGARIAPGAECSAGGLRVRSFRDVNGDGAPQPSEIIDDVVLCDPARSLVRTSTITTQTSTCPRGGIRIDIGLDDDADGALAESEIDQSNFVCNGASPTILDVRPEPAGVNCTHAGHVVLAGEDRDEDGVLDVAEIDSTSYLCSGPPGVGRTALRIDVEPPGANCLVGGHALRSGPDDDGDGALDPGEVTNTTFLCNTAARSSLVNITVIAPGAVCPQGGQQIDAGLDANGNLALDASEVTSSATLCDGGGGSGSVQILTTALTPARLREPWAADLTVAGGTAAYTWTIPTGTLPPGLRLVSDSSGAGRIEGLPNTAGTYAFAVRVTDAGGSVATRTLSLDVTPDLFLDVRPLPTAELGVAYTATIATGGAAGPITWTVTGALPTGLVFAPTGSNAARITGTPTEARTTTVLVSATSAGTTVTAPFTVGFAPRWVAYERDEMFGMIPYELGASYIDGPMPGPPLHLSGPFSSPGLIGYERGVAISPTHERLVFPSSGPLSTVTFSGGSASTAAPAYSGTARSFEPIWSPTGEHVAFEQRIAGNVVDTWTLAVTPTGYAAPVRAHPVFATGVSASYPSWSPDGTRIVFFVRMGSTWDLYVDDVTDAALGFPLTASPITSLFGVRFSPDSRYVYFAADLDTVGQLELFRVDVSGTSPGPPQQVSGAMITLGDIDDFALSPAGDRVFYIADALTDGRRQLFVADVASPTPSTPRLASHPNPGSSQEVLEGWWSPDGRAIAFGGDLRTNDVHELFLVGASAGATMPFRVSDDLVPGGDVGGYLIVRTEDVAWAPDGNRLFYLADATTPTLGELWSVDLQGAPFVEAVSRQGATAPNVDAFEITADGRYVKYTNINTLDAAVRIDGPTLPAALVPATYFSFTPRNTTYLRGGRVAVTEPGGVHLLDPAAGTATQLVSAQTGETYRWTIAPP
ncbi:MAG: putative Ig domain-containing protein [Deltaproteobacteria bacterium]